jgi:hypothetical protein
LTPMICTVPADRKVRAERNRHARSIPTTFPSVVIEKHQVTVGEGPAAQTVSLETAHDVADKPNMPDVY